MYSFGTRPPRALESFGVSGLLGEECQVFYENLFGTKHVGRVSDLLCARLKDAGLDELKVRAAILFTVFEAYRSQSGIQKKALASPMILELGIDQEKVAIGLSFVEKSGSPLQESGLRERLLQGKPQGLFETLLWQLSLHSDRLVLRVQPEAKRYEAVSLMALPGKIQVDGNAGLEVIKLSPAQAESAPRAKGYTQLGDLDYPELLREQGPEGKEGPAKAISDILVKGMAPESEAENRVGGKDDGPNADKIKVQGESLEEALQKVKGNREELGSNHVTIVKGDGADLHEAGMLTVKGGDPVLSEKLKEYELKVAFLERKLADAQAGSSSGGAQAEKKGFFGLFNKVWPFGKKASSTENASPGSSSSSSFSSSVSDVPPSGVDPVPPEEAVKESPEELLDQAQAGGIAKTADRAAREVGGVKKEIPSTRAKAWVDGLVTELIAEKARLTDLFRKMTTSFRQKEYAFKNKEFGYTEELRRRQDLLNQKDSQIARLKDQVSEITMTLERLRSGSKDGGENSPYKHKYQMSQKMLQSLKDENHDLKVKMEDFRSKWMTAQGQAQKTVVSGSMDKELTMLRLSHERAVRQLEEYKAKNQQLSDRLNEMRKEESLKGNVDEVRRRLESTHEKLVALQKEHELLGIKNNEQEGKISQLNDELAKTQAELRVAQSRAARAEKEKKLAAAKAAALAPKTGGGIRGTGGTGGSTPTQAA